MKVKQRALKVSAFDCKKIPLSQRVNFKMIDPTTCGSKQLSFGLVIVAPRGTCEPGHSHDDQEEIFYCLSGKGVVVADDERREIPIAPYDAVFFKPGVYHSIKNPTDIPLEALWILSPGGWVFDRNPGLKKIARDPAKAKKANKNIRTSLNRAI